jgi:rhamnose transport system permease protein
MAHDTTVSASSPPVGSDGDASASSRGLAGTPLATWDAAVLGLLVAVAVVAAVVIDPFAQSSNVRFLLLDVVAIGLIALPMTLVIITGEIDLSVASTLGLASAVMGQLWSSGLPINTIVVLCLLLGALLGAANGFFVTRLGLPSLAVTIGTLALYRGLAFVVLGDRAVADYPASLTSAATSTVPGLPIPWAFMLFVVLAVMAGTVLHATPIGRSLYAIGANDEAASFSGVEVARTKFWLFVASGSVSALAGVFWTLRYASARADNGAGLELSVVAAVLLGGVSIFGGKGALPGVLGGVLLLGTLTNALQLASVSADALTVVTGLLLIASVVMPNLAARVRARIPRRAAKTTTTGAS